MKIRLFIVVLCLVFMFGILLSAFVLRPPEKDDFYKVGYIYDTRNGSKIYLYSERPITYSWTDIGFTRIHLIIPCEDCPNRTTVVYYISR